MLRITEVTKILLIINIVIYFGSNMLLGGTGTWYLALHYPFSSADFQPYQIVSHMFMHASTSHLFFNMFGLFMFGPPLEMAWGAKRFLFYYLFTGFGALALHLLIATFEGAPGSVVGASGAIFGLLVGFGMLYPNQRIMLLIPPIPMKAKYFVLIYAGIELFLGVSNYQPGVAHFAHLGGALFGFLLITYWNKYGSKL